MKKSKSAKNSSNNALIVGVIVVLLLGVYIWKQKGTNWLTGMPSEEKEVAMSSGTPTPKPKPRKLNPGKETFTYAPGPKAVGPKIYEFSLDPFDVKTGVKQTITVKATYTSPITSVTARLDTDTKKTNLTFTRVAGTDTNGTWQATLTADDTHEETYYLDFTLVGQDATYNGGFAFR